MNEVRGSESRVFCEDCIHHTTETIEHEYRLFWPFGKLRKVTNVIDWCEVPIGTPVSRSEVRPAQCEIRNKDNYCGYFERKVYVES